MEYREIVRDFAKRTRSNLDLLRELQRENPEKEIYEVTQLMNSMLGLLVFPQQNYVNKISKTPLSELEENGWPVPHIVGQYQQVRNLNQLVRYLRNAIAHFNIKFQVDDDYEICGLHVWNEYEGRTTWKAGLS